jgi:hypothetical protein
VLNCLRQLSGLRRRPTGCQFRFPTAVVGLSPGINSVFPRLWPTGPIRLESVQAVSIVLRLAIRFDSEWTAGPVTLRWFTICNENR